MEGVMERKQNENLTTARPFSQFLLHSTCFNRIDVPNYTSKKELYEKLKAAITLSSVGFDME